MLIWIAFNPFEKHERGCKNQWAGRTHPCMSTLLYLSEEHPHFSPNTHCGPFIQLIIFSFWACLWVSALSWMSYRCQRRSNVHSTKMELANYPKQWQLIHFSKGLEVISDLSSLVCHLPYVEEDSCSVTYDWIETTKLQGLLFHVLEQVKSSPLSPLRQSIRFPHVVGSFVVFL